MKIVEAVKRAFSDKSAQVNESHTHEATMENLRLLASNTIALKGLISKLDSGEISDDQFIAICVSSLSRELLQYRELEEKHDMQNW